MNIVIKRQRKILLFGYYGFCNIGDDMMLNTLISHLADRFPDAQFGIVSRKPVKIIDRRKIDIQFIRLNFFHILWNIFKYEVVILGGGTVIFDFNKNIKYLRPLSKILSFLFLTRVLGKKSILAGVGVGPLGTWWSKILARKILGLADFILVRDHVSFDNVIGLGISPCSVMHSFDMAVLIDKGQDVMAPSVGTKVLGISIFPFYEIYYGNKKKDAIMVEQILSFLKYQFEKDGGGYDEVSIFILKNKSKQDDDEISLTLAKKIKPLAKVNVFFYDGDPNFILSQIKRCSFVVSMRFHSALLAYLANIPQLLIAYFPKCVILAEEIGIPREMVFTPEGVLAGNLMKQGLSLRSNSYVYSYPQEQAKAEVRFSLEQLVNFIRDKT